MPHQPADQKVNRNNEPKGTPIAIASKPHTDLSSNILISGATFAMFAVIVGLLIHFFVFKRTVDPPQTAAPLSDGKSAPARSSLMPPADANPSPGTGPGERAKSDISKETVEVPAQSTEVAGPPTVTQPAGIDESSNPRPGSAATTFNPLTERQKKLYPGMSAEQVHFIESMSGQQASLPEEETATTDRPAGETISLSHAISQAKLDAIGRVRSGHANLATMMQFAADEANVSNRRYTFTSEVISMEERDGAILFRIPVNLRLFLTDKLDERHAKLSGSLTMVSSWRASLGPNYWFLTNEGTLRPLPRDDTPLSIENAGGQVYVSEANESLLFVKCDATNAQIKELREAAGLVPSSRPNCIAAIAVERLRRTQRFDNGFYLLSELRKDLDSDDIVNWNLSGAFGVPKVPPYFRVDVARPPEVVEATLSGVQLIRTDTMQVLGSYFHSRTDTLTLERHPVPTSDKLTAAQARLTPELAKQRLEVAEPSSQVDRAKKIFALAEDTADDLPRQFFLANRALAMLANGGDVDSVLFVVNWLALRFEIDLFAKRTEYLIKLAGRNLDDDAARKLDRELRENAMQAVGAGRFDLANRLLTSAIALARRRADSATVRKLEEEQSGLQKLKRKAATSTKGQ